MQFDFIRPLTAEEYAGLKADIAAHGQHFPIVHDQNGVTIDGHHRERILAELGIPPKIDRRSFGSDRERLAFVLSANIHRRQSTIEDRKRLAERLYKEHGMTEAQIATMLGVSQWTISNDLRGLEITSKPHRPKGGRPKSSKPEGKHKYDASLEAKAASSVLDGGKGVVKTAEALGVSQQVVIRATERERGRREAHTEKMVSIHVLIEELHPLFERVREQSQRHLAQLSKSELAIIASEGKRLLDRWASDDPTVRRVRGHVVPPTARQKEASDGRSL
jgi:predicted transcriptional regulator